MTKISDNLHLSALDFDRPPFSIIGSQPKPTNTPTGGPSGGPTTGGPGNPTGGPTKGGGGPGNCHKLICP